MRAIGRWTFDGEEACGILIRAGEGIDHVAQLYAACFCLAPLYIPPEISAYTSCISSGRTVTSNCRFLQRLFESSVMNTNISVERGLSLNARFEWMHIFLRQIAKLARQRSLKVWSCCRKNWVSYARGGRLFAWPIYRHPLKSLLSPNSAFSSISRSV